MNKFILAVGDMQTGFTFVGPFLLRDDAALYAESFHAQESWCIQTLFTPDVVELDDECRFYTETGEPLIAFSENGCVRIMDPRHERRTVKDRGIEIQRMSFEDISKGDQIEFSPWDAKYTVDSATSERVQNWAKEASN